MRILVVSYTFEPVISPRAFRWGAIVRQWLAAGHEVDVVTARVDGAPDLEEQGPLTIHRCGFARRSTGATQKGSGRSASSGGSVGSTLKRATIPIQSIVAKGWRSLRWPDYASAWYLPACRQTLQLTGDTNYDAMVTVSHPFTSHLVGLRVHRRCALPWIVDIGDPFSFSTEMPLNNVRLYRPFNLAAERRVFSRASKVVVTNDRTREIYAKTFPGVSIDRISTIGPMIDVSAIEQIRSESPWSDDGDVVRLVFAGNLFNPVRRPGEFLAWMQKVSLAWQQQQGRPALHWHLFGDNPQSLESVSPELPGEDRFHFHGRVKRDEVATYLQHADVLLNCGNTTDYQLASKIVEYMALSKPIINVTFNRNDPVIGTLSGYPRHINAWWDDEPGNDVLEFIDRSVRTRERFQTVDSSLVASYGAAAIAGAYERLIA
ncbi:glycosyltransferase [Maioricimonas sp. JC845]|uniref:glycosyltransferase n=1 Tax=Maioricimonas sp. JC845 TaxID=3232138 RepID=UPI00345A3015